LKKKLLIIPPILIGVAVLAFMIGGWSAPERKPPQERPRAVRTITADQVMLVPRVTGYGSVYPGTVWSAIAQVAGEVVYVHPGLKKGAILPAGTEILRISPVDFELAVAQATANIRSAEAKLVELKVTETNTTDLLEIERRGLKLREADVKRKKALLGRGTVAKTSYETAQRDTLSQLKLVQDLKNKIRLLPTQRAVQQEQIAVYRAQHDSAKLDLSRTHIILPFEARIGVVSVEVEQFAQLGGTLVTADSLDVAEVEAQIPISQFRAMIHASADGQVPVGVAAANLSRIVKTIGFEATVRLRAADETVEWPARFARISDAVDPKTRTIGAIVTVEGAYAKAQPGQRPPLAKGMFVEIEIRTRAKAGQIVVPRSALHDGNVYILDSDSRLALRPVTVGLVQGDIAVIDVGITSGETIVVSDLVPAVAGMLLMPQPDEQLRDRLRAEAKGGVAAK
jgi:membrane fusion protein, multidrug efflux system